MRIVRSFAGFTLAACFAGCMPQASSSHLVKGEAYVSGKEQYDTFFGSVAEIRTKTDSTEGETPLRKKVASALGLKDNARSSETLDAARVRSSELKKDGGKLYVVLDGEARLVMKAGSEDSAAAKEFVDVIGSTIKDGLARSDSLTSMAKEAEVLEAALPGLESDLLASFPDPTTFEQVKIELDASKQLLEVARLKAESESGRALRYAVLLAGAVDSGAAAELLAAQAKGNTDKKPKWFGKGGKGGAAKPPKAKPKQDFDP